MDIDKLNREFNELVKNFDEKAITEWLEKKRLEEREEKQNKRSEQFYCVAKEHYPELVGDGVCDKQCKKCKKLKL